MIKNHQIGGPDDVKKILENKNEAVIQGIFPTPIYINKLRRNLTEEEFNFMSSHLYKNNSSNKISTNFYILDNPKLINLKHILEWHLNFFYNNIWSPNLPSKIYITQSWLNFTKKNEYHGSHRHPNSFLSGVFYVKTKKNYDKIIFEKSDYQTISPMTNNPNPFNLSEHVVEVAANDIVLFPSFLFHSVPKVTYEDDVRISLAFNSFIEGNIGETLTAANLKLSKCDQKDLESFEY
ncbi:MAG: hypothetical protein EBX41_09010 [Chitinophagia bacterium]|nr:hypothetical protein [Chitinophagia bacterium]